MEGQGKLQVVPTLSIFKSVLSFALGVAILAVGAKGGLISVGIFALVPF